MKLSLAVAATMAVSVQAFNQGQPVDFAKFRIGHTGIARDAAPQPEAENVEIDPRNSNYRYHQFHDAPIFVEAGRVPPQPENAGNKEHRPCHGGKGHHGGFSISGLLQRLGLAPSPIENRRGAWDFTASAVHPNHNHGHHGHHGDDHGDKHHGKHGKHHDHEKSPEHSLDDSKLANILPIFGEDTAHKAIEDGFKQAQAESEDEPKPKHHHHHGDKHHHKHKDGKKHKHHGHHGKHGKHHGNKVFSTLSKTQHKLCDALKNLPPALRGFVIGAVIGAVLQVFFSLAILFIRLRRGRCAASREARRERRRERKEARKAAKAAYKAAKSGNAKAAEAGFEIEEEEEALPSYAEGEHDPLVVRQ